ncbi:hypothetical protein BDQ17DRAFT_1434439 [Cyathus striatus]|nr:hypothetical protein BDQ17DRAFT_1434439 [Cyathus striatus]
MQEAIPDPNTKSEWDNVLQGQAINLGNISGSINTITGSTSCMHQIGELKIILPGMSASTKKVTNSGEWHTA